MDIKQRDKDVLRAVRFEYPEAIPMHMSVSNACWHHYPQDVLQALILEHPLLFPDYVERPLPIEPDYAPWRIAARRHTDSWECVWETVEDGITGAVVKPALPTWTSFDAYQPPDPAHHNGWTPIDWVGEAERVRAARRAGRLSRGSLRHGHTFLTLSYMRGYEALLFDMADEDPRLERLLEMVETFNLGLVERYIDLGVDWMGYPEDLGMQWGPMLSPAQFRKYIKPVYRRLMAPARAAGCVIHMHSDGDVRALAEDLLDCGVDVLNIQDLVNGVDWIADHLVGRVCIDLDIDRQNIVRFGTPEEIEAHIHEVVSRLGRPEGGLMLTHGLYPGVPLENAGTLMDAMERYTTYYTG
ncbi:MAG: uroporphyrinogen decarboxylase family protein [Anaerolineae bacterium]